MKPGSKKCLFTFLLVWGAITAALLLTRCAMIPVQLPLNPNRPAYIDIINERGLWFASNSDWNIVAKFAQHIKRADRSSLVVMYAISDDGQAASVLLHDSDGDLIFDNGSVAIGRYLMDDGKEIIFEPLRALNIPAGDEMGQNDFDVIVALYSQRTKYHIEHFRKIIERARALHVLTS